MRRAPRGGGRRFDLGQRQTRVIEERLAGRGQLDAACAAGHEPGADLALQLAQLTAERRLRRAQPPLGGDRDALLLGHGNEITEMPQLHACPCLRSMRHNLQSLSFRRQKNPDSRRPPLPSAGGHTWEDWTMSNPVVLITGGLSGIGRAAALAFAKKGAKVVVAGRRDEAGKALAKELRAFGSEAEFINADVRKEDDVRALVDKTVARFGRLDVAVNNAATEGQVGPITDQTAESFAATFETNVLGVVLSMKHEVRAMQAQGSGSIINISSTYGHEGAAGASIYVGAKHAVEGITKSVALEIAKSGIRVNAVAPGPTDTGMLTRFTGTAENKAALAVQVPLGRLGLSEEVADGIVFIASDEARFITGHVLNVDGGQSAN